VHQPDVTTDELPTELSGVLCRCTGYRNIVAAVADVAARYPDGIPGPRNCQVRALVGRTAGAPQAPDSTTQDVAPAATDIAPPVGEPTIRIDVASELGAAVDEVWAVLADVRLVARCLPGAELTDDLGGDHYRGHARISLGPIRLSFAGSAQVVERDAVGHRMRVLAHGADTGGGQTKVDIQLAATPTDRGTLLRATADVHLTGRIAQFGRALAGDVSRRMFEQFTSAVQQAVTTGTATDVRAGAARLIVADAGRRLLALVRRLFR
jgi:carbon-monoxide dehydrogenase small subunit